jgi:hypothetical protein
MSKPFILWMAISLAAISHSFAGDTTYRKKNPWLISGSAGYTINRAFGTVMDNQATFNAMFGIKNAGQKNGGGSLCIRIR